MDKRHYGQAYPPKDDYDPPPEGANPSSRWLHAAWVEAMNNEPVRIRANPDLNPNPNPNPNPSPNRNRNPTPTPYDANPNPAPFNPT